MIINENFLDLFSNWEFFFIKYGKNRVFCIRTGAHNRPLRNTEKIPVVTFHKHVKMGDKSVANALTACIFYALMTSNAPKCGQTE